jgi:hypothetical protein
VTTAWVLTEVANALSHPSYRQSFTRLLALLKADPNTEIVPASPSLFEHGSDARSRYRVFPQHGRNAHRRGLDPLRGQPDFQLLIMDLAMPAEPFARAN